MMYVQSDYDKATLMHHLSCADCRDLDEGWSVRCDIPNDYWTAMTPWHGTVEVAP